MQKGHFSKQDWRFWVKGPRPSQNIVSEMRHLYRRTRPSLHLLDRESSATTAVEGRTGPMGTYLPFRLYGYNTLVLTWMVNFSPTYKTHFFSYLDNTKVLMRAPKQKPTT